MADLSQIGQLKTELSAIIGAANDSLPGGTEKCGNGTLRHDETACGRCQKDRQ